jgi:hypothetical protein
MLLLNNHSNNNEGGPCLRIKGLLVLKIEHLLKGLPYVDYSNVVDFLALYPTLISTYGNVYGKVVSPQKHNDCYLPT